MNKYAYFLMISVVILPFAANAQFVPNIEPGRIQERLDDRTRPEVRDESIIDGIALPGSGPELAPGISFTLKGIKLTGNTAITTSKLTHIYNSSIGKEVSLQDVQAIVDSLTSHYRNAGYILSRAILPPQRIGNGEVTIQIIEGVIDQIEFQGVEAADSTLQAYGEKIRSSVPLNSADLERYLLLMDDLAGMTARGTLRASQNIAGASDLIVTLQRRTFDGRATIDNRGSRFIGPLQGDVALSANHLLGLNERITLRTLQTLNLDELSYLEGSYQQPIGDDGLSLRILGSVTDTEPGNALQPLNVEGDSVTFLANATYPYIRSRRENLFASLGFTYRDSESDTLGIQTYEDNIRLVNAGLSYDFIDSWAGVSGVSFTLTQGLELLGANNAGDLLSRAGADADFTKLSFDATRLQSLNNQFALRISARGQYADEPLFASEEFGVGGVSFGGAYDSSEISGDQGIAGRGELQYNGLYNNAWLDHYQIYTYYDAARVWNVNALAGENTSASLASAGLGVRFNVFDQWRGYVEYAMPLTRNVSAEGTDGSDNRIFFSMSYLLP